MAELDLTWALCVATLNRIEMLEHCVRCALGQTRPPLEITIVDASDDWQGSRQRIEAIVSGSVKLNYLPAPVRSSTVQRNTGIAACSADICVLIDDDSFMHADCAEIIMQVYEADRDGEILGIAGSDGPSPIALGDAARKEGTVESGRERMMSASKFREFIWRELFLMSRTSTFVAYDGPIGSYVPDWAVARGFDLVPAIQLPGCQMTVRRSAALRDPFESAFRSYSPGEDFDISYRLSRRGAICVATGARIYHHEVATSRIRREQELLLSICNVAYLLRRHSPALDRDRRRWRVLMSRRILAEFLKDGLTRRWRFPQFRAARKAARLGREVLAYSDDDSLADYYVRMQEDILKRPA
ncbi:MAG: glycosyltransferase family 2 protein [Paracoccus sp. (in: a-proteobacteria)]